MSLDSASSDIIFSIISYLSHHNILLINRISHHFNNFYNSDSFRNILISEIGMNLEFNKYSLSQLKNIFLMTKPRNLYGSFMLRDGKFYYLNEHKGMRHIIHNSYFIQIDDDNLLLDDKGNIHRVDANIRDNYHINLIHGPNNIVKLLGNNHVMDVNGKHYVVHDKWRNIGNWDFIRYGYFDINNAGYLFSDDQISNYNLDHSKRYIRNEGSILLDDIGNVYLIGIGILLKKIPVNNIISISHFYCDNLCLLLDNKGKVYYFNVKKFLRDKDITNTDIIPILGLNNIIEISSADTNEFLAIDYYNRINILYFIEDIYFTEGKLDKIDSFNFYQ